MFTILVILVVFLWECTAETCTSITLKHQSTNRRKKEAINGLYHFEPDGADPYLIYCDFKVGYGYTFISTTTYQYTFPGDHNVDRSGFKIILLYSNGSQHEVEISRPKKSRKIDILYTYESAYNNWLSNDLMYPYITVSMKSRKRNMKSQGYFVNGEKLPDCACDGLSYKKKKKHYTNLIFAFLFNHNYTDPLEDGNKRKGTDLLKKWVRFATPVPDDKKLPRNFFSFFEIHHKNCGGYVTIEDFTDIIGAAIGLKYVIKCGTPPEIANTTKDMTGYEYNSVVTYKCNGGYEFEENKTTLTCSAKGEWQGNVSKCIQRKPRTCLDHENMFNARISGVYIVFDRYNLPYEIYCDIYDNFTLTFLTSNYMNPRNFKYHYNDNTVAVVRSYVSGQRQVDSEIKHLVDGQRIKITYDFVRLGYKRRRRLLSLIVESHRHLGYRVNDVEVRASEYYYGYYGRKTIAIKFQILFDTPSKSYGDNSLHVLLTKWYNESKSIPGERYMPKQYFFTYKLSTAIEGKADRGLSDVYGINIGLVQTKVNSRHFIALISVNYKITRIKNV